VHEECLLGIVVRLGTSGTSARSWDIGDAWDDAPGLGTTPRAATAG
jgi:hypothetical protein